MTCEEVIQKQKQGIEEQVFRTIHDDRPELFLVCPVPAGQNLSEENNAREE